MYRVNLRRRVLRELESPPDKDYRIVVKALEKLEENPRPLGVKQLSGCHCEELLNLIIIGWNGFEGVSYNSAVYLKFYCKEA